MKRYVVLLILLFIAGCNNSNNKNETQSNGVINSTSEKENLKNEISLINETMHSSETLTALPKLELDTLLVPQFPKDTNGWLLDIKTDVQILLPAWYRGTERADFEPMLSEEWYDFYRDSITKNYFLKKANIKIGKRYDDCLGDSTTYVGSQRKSLIFIKGIIPQNEEISSINVKKGYTLWAGEEHPFYFNNKKYVFRGDGDIIKTSNAWTDDGEERWDEVQNYKLYLSEQGKEEQLIVAIPTFDDTFVRLLWIGDLDGDGKPDFILDTSRHYEETTVLLFLSSKAGEGEIVRVVASSSYQSDC